MIKKLFFIVIPAIFMFLSYYDECKNHTAYFEIK